MIPFRKTTAVLVGFILVAVGMSLWAQQPGASRPRRQARTRPQQSLKPAPKAAAEPQGRPPYVVEPPDLLLVEVLEALPGRPISGERLVRPDGCISLGFYGDLPVAGLTIAEIKEKIVQHLRKFLSDETLGLVETDTETGERRVDPKTEEAKEIPPRETDRVFVDVTAYNSAMVYVEGDVVSPGRISYTGGDNVLDLIHHAEGLLPSADRGKIRLVRSFPKGSPARVLPVNYEEITMGTDSSTNYPTLPNDRLVVPRDPSYVPPRDSDEEPSPSAFEESDRPGRAIRGDSATEKNTDFGRKPSPSRAEESSELERRVGEIETKLDRLIEMMEVNKAKPAARSSDEPVEAPPEERSTVSRRATPDGRDRLQANEERPVDPSPGNLELPPLRDPFEMEPQGGQNSEPSAVQDGERRARIPARDRDTIPRRELQRPNSERTQPPPARREARRPALGRMPAPRSRREVLRRSPGGASPTRKAEPAPKPPSPPNTPQERSPFDDSPQGH